VRRLPAAFRYLMLHRLAFAVTALTVLITATSTAATAVFASTAAAIANKQTLTDDPTSSVLVSVLAAPSAANTAAVTGTISRSAPGLPISYFTAALSDPLNLAHGIGGERAQTFILGIDQFRQHARLVAGSWPGRDTRGVVQACLPARAAQLLGVRAGDELRTTDALSHAAVAIQVTCTFSPRSPAGPFWRLNTIGATAVSRTGGFTTYGPMLTSQPAASWPTPAAAAEWMAQPDFAAMTARDLAALSNSVGNGLSALQNSNSLSASVSTNLPVLLSNQATTLEVARSELLVWQLILLVIVGAALSVAVQLLASQRASEPSLLMARGAARRQLAGRGMTDALVLAVPAAIGGPLIGAGIAPLIARLHLIGAGSVTFPARLPTTAWLAGIGVAASCALIVALPWLRAPVTPIQRRAGKARQRAITAILSTGADLALVLLAGGAAWQLAHYSAPVSTGVSGYIGVDPILVAAPVLALTAGTLIMLRLLPLLIKLTERLAARGRGITVPTAAWMIGRRTMRQAGSALLTVLAVATAVVALAQTASWQQSIHDQAAFDVGADTNVLLPPAAPMPIGQVGQIIAAKGVRSAAPVIRLADVLPNNDPATVLAVDPAQARQVVPVRSDLLMKRFPDPFASIAGAGSAPGEVLPGRPDQLEVVASLSRAPVSLASLTLQLTDAAGIGYQVPVGTVPADGAGHRFLVAISAGGRADYPLSITGFNLAYQLPESGHGQLAALTIRSVAVSGPGQASREVGALWPAASTPTVDVTGVDLSSNTVLGYADQPKEHDLTSAGHGAVLRFKTGAGISNSYQQTNQRNQTVNVEVPADAELNVTMPALPVLPAIATSSFLAASGEHLGQQYQITGLPVQVPVRLVAEIAQFPTVNSAGGGLIISQPALQSFEETNGAGSMPVTEWWLRVSGQPDLGDLPSGSTVTTQAGVANSLSSQPLTVAPVDSLVAVAAVALLLACLGFLVSVTASRERGRDLAVLDALGATPGQLTRLLCLEQGMLSLPAAAGGLALGLLLSRLIIPAVTLTAAAAHPVPSVIVRVPVLTAAAVAVAVAAFPVAAVAFSIRRGTATVARLRAEEET
jgi:hypothetical protein